MAEVWPDARMWRTLIEHAHEIAVVCSSLHPDALALAQCDRNGAWLGCYVVHKDDALTRANAHAAFSFYFPRTCDTPTKVAALVEEHWEAQED